MPPMSIFSLNSENVGSEFALVADALGTGRSQVAAERERERERRRRRRRRRRREGGRE